MKGPKLRMCSTLLCGLASLSSAAEPGVTPPEYEPYVLGGPEGLPNGLNGRLKANGRSTRGNYSVVVRESETSQAADLHTHSQLVEAWYVVEGSMTFQSSRKVIEAPAGTFVLVPPGVEHGFRIAAGRSVRLVQIFSPPGFENLFSERLKLPSYDPGKEIGQQSAQWKADQKDIARKYGAGPVEQASSGLPVVRVPEVGSARALASEDDTAGRYTLHERTLESGTVPNAAGRAAETDQAWYLLSGELHFDLKKADGWQHKKLTAGDFAFAPRGTAFNLSNPGNQPSRFLHWQSKPRAPLPN